jgi:membrane fusion protein, multidrug efflux system
MEAKQEKQPKKTLRTILILAFLAMAVAGVVMYMNKDSDIESTDDAQTDGNIVPLRAGVTGYITKINFTDNQMVKKGDTLIVFDASEFKAKVMQAEAALENAASNRSASESRVKVSEDNSVTSELNTSVIKENINSTKANLDRTQNNLNRLNELVKVKGATQEQLDNAKTAVIIAQSDYNKALEQLKATESSINGVKSQVNSDRSQITVAGTTIKQRQADLLLVQEQLKRVVVTATCDGIVTKRTVQEGQFVSTGQSLCTIIENKSLWVTANLKETQLKNIKIGQSVDIKLDAYPDLILRGRVETINGATGAKFSLFPPDNSTGNFIKVTQRFPLKIAIDNLPKGDAVLFPGLSAFVKIKIK